MNHRAGGKQCAKTSRSIINGARRAECVGRACGSADLLGPIDDCFQLQWDADFSVIEINWKRSAAVYSTFSTDYTELAIKPTHTDAYQRLLVSQLESCRNTRGHLFDGDQFQEIRDRRGPRRRFRVDRLLERHAGSRAPRRLDNPARVVERLDIKNS